MTRNATAAKFYANADRAVIIADFALDMLASALRTGMNTHTVTFEALRMNTIAAITEAQNALDCINRTEQAATYLGRYNAIIDAA
jgi:hypothetical protein